MNKIFQPESLKTIRRLELRARTLVEGMLSGRHKSPFFGQSLEFRQHREYARGDDLRRIDWKVWGKQDKYYVKQFEDETNLRASLLVDVSESMLYGGRGSGMSKYDYAATLAVSIAYLLLRQQDSAGAISFDDEIQCTVPQKMSRNHLNSIIQALDVDVPRRKTRMDTMLERVAEIFPRRGMMILFSDLFTPREELWKGLKRLCASGHDVIVFHILHDDELDFTFDGPSQFEGLEEMGRLRCNPRALREAYLEILNEYLVEIRRGCAQLHIDYSLVRTSDPFDRTLNQLLQRRMKH
ncbi:MAG: DUF58 domain-containing protein [Planctomycetia bacterium]|nr:DUF58 domain-containing protein [Planctomycetia bacterium]